MAKRPVGRPFQKGQSGNPGGRHKLPEDIRKARALNQVELERTVNRFLYMDRAQVQEAIKNPETPMIDLMVASIMAQAAQKGDERRLEFILQRMIGRVTDKIEVKTPTPFVISRASGDQLVLGAKVEDDDAPPG